MDISQLSTNEQRVLLLIGKDYEHRTKAAELMEKTSFSRRYLYAIIRGLREKGYMVVSTTQDGGGYWLTAGYDEIKAFSDRMERFGKSVFSAVSKARKTVKKHFPAQTEMTER